MKKKFLSIFIALVLALSLCLVTAVPVAAATITVPGDYSTIQAAIDAAGTDDIISVGAGTYVGDLVIPAGKDNLELVGATGATIKGVATYAGPFPGGIPNIDILSPGVKIHGFTIESPNAVADEYASGMLIGAPGVEIYNNDFEIHTQDAGQYSVVIQTYREVILEGVDISGLNIHDNTFYDLEGGTVGYDGIFVNLDAGTGLVTIEDNEFNGSLMRAISVERSNVVINNNSIITDLAPGPGYQGIYIGCWPLDGERGPVQSNVVITGNTVKGSGEGLGFNQGIRVGHSTQLGLSGIIVSQNTVEGNNEGIAVKAPVDATPVDVVINNNSIVGNTLGAKIYGGTLAVLNATSNWWGTAISAEIAAMVSGAVTYTGWLLQAPTWVEMTATSSLATPPTVATDAASAVAFTLATLNGDLTSMGSAGAVDVSFGYDTITHSGDPSLYTNWTTTQQLASTGTFFASIDTLAPGTTYYFAARAKGDDVVDPVYGAEVSFTTAAVTTLDATDIGAYTATLNGHLELGSATSVEVEFEWGLTTGYGTTAMVTPSPMTVSGDFSADLSGLALDTTYNFQAVGLIGADEGYGGNMTFVTVQRLGISVSPTSIDFGDIIAGHSSTSKPVTVTNEGDASQIFTAELQDEVPAGFYTTNLAIDDGTVAVWTTAEVIPTGFVEPGLVLSIPIVETVGAKTATLIFWAEAY